MSAPPDSAVPFVPLEEHALRRARVLETLGRGAMLLGAGPPSNARDAAPGRFRPHSDFLYLTGFREPGAVALLRPGAEAPYTLFVAPRDPEREAWDGPRAGPDGARELHGADAGHPIGELGTRLPGLLDGAEPLFYAPWRDAGLDRAVSRALATLRARERIGRRAPDAVVDPGVLLHEMRLVKSDAELSRLERAAEITARAHRAAMARCRPGAREYELQAEIERVFRAEGASGPAYATIVGAGANGTILHYTANRGTIRDEDLVLVDAGAEFGDYAADITRTFPASGRLGGAALALYRTVLAAQEQAVAAIRPGATLDGVHDGVVRTLTEGLVELGLLEGDLDELVSSSAFKPYFMHKTSHWLGLDVHDAGRTRIDGEPRPLLPGMVLTVEPGLYVPTGDEGAPDELRGRAVRIEDDVVVTEDGGRVLTRGVPVEPGEIEALVGAAGVS